jgi:F-type H+-transporting ATPase subunit b
VSINGTLVAQAIVFALLVLFTMKFVWPPIAAALDERAGKIADGLAAADKAKSELSSANKRVEEELTKSRTETAARLADAERRGQAIVEEAKAKATDEANKIIAAAKAEADQQTIKAREACVSRLPHWRSRVPSRFSARKLMPVCMPTCWVV